MKGSDVIHIATAVYGIKWFDQLCVELGIKDEELSALTKTEEVPGPVDYALRDIATKYMVRVESMNVNNKFSDALLNGKVDDTEQANFMIGVLKGMELVLAALHGEPEKLKQLATEKDFSKLVESYMQGGN